jgi:hypothetical protein
MTIVKYIGEKIIDSTENPLFLYCGYLSNSTPHAFSLIYNNYFLSKEKKKTILDFYNRSKRIYNIFRKLAIIWRWKKYKKINIDFDLFLNKLSTFKSCQKIDIIQRKSIYTFRLTDLLNIWEKSLTNSEGTTPHPKNPMNPYTNIKFSIADLTNIYLSTLNANLTPPIIISIYWKCFFNIRKFRFEAYPYLKDVAIQNHIKNSDPDLLYFDILEMIAHFKRELNGQNISYYPNILFKNLIVKRLKPILNEFLLGTESSNYVKKIYYYKQCRKNIKKFFNLNPSFGRRIVNVNRNINDGSSQNSPSSYNNDISDNDISGNSISGNDISGNDIPVIPYNEEVINDPEINNIDFSNIFSENNQNQQSADESFSDISIIEFSEESDVSSNESVS